MYNINSPKVVLITGGSSAIGEATAILFAKRGFQVALTDGDEEKINKLVQECSRLSPNKLKAYPIISDLIDPKNGELIVRKTMEQFKKIDILVNNAETFLKTHSADKDSFELYKDTMAINCDSIIRTTMEALPHLDSSRGNIVFISNLASMSPGYESYAYRMSKAAITSYAKCLAIDVAPKIRVNIVSVGQSISRPSTMLNAGELNPINLGLFGNRERPYHQKGAYQREGNSYARIEYEEISNTILYLASDEASFVNGAELFVDFGYRLAPE